jgi:hypothetical protein
LANDFHVQFVPAPGFVELSVFPKPSWLRYDRFSFTKNVLWKFQPVMFFAT